MKSRCICPAHAHSLLFLLFANSLIYSDPVLASTPETTQPTKIIAKKYEYIPKEITVKKGQLAVLELTSPDRTHGFNSPDLKLHASIEPGKVVQVKFTPEKTGEYAFFCDVFCGAGHEDMTGKIKVID